MPSFLFKCIPCARSRKIPITDEREPGRVEHLYQKQSLEYSEPRICYAVTQQTPTAVRARGFELVEMGTTTGDGSNSDTKGNK